MTTGFAPGQTGLVLLVPEAEPVVGPWRTRFEPSSALGVPAHITVLYPFLPADQLDDATLAELARLFAMVDPFDLRLPRFGRFPDGVLYLEPEPTEPCRRLTDLVVQRWPDHPPYGGLHAEAVPHLTVAMGAAPHEEGLVEEHVAPLLPLAARLTAVDLMTFDGTRWTARARFPLGR